ncbi:MAG TPA: hypothetical protein PKW33_20770 [Anaerolineaceae bacterium]|nr:hypothetical protein [Anaerolineaceae bacterium]
MFFCLSPPSHALQQAFNLDQGFEAVHHAGAVAKVEGNVGVFQRIIKQMGG